MPESIHNITTNSAEIYRHDDYQNSTIDNTNNKITVSNIDDASLLGAPKAYSNSTDTSVISDNNNLSKNNNIPNVAHTLFTAQPSTGPIPSNAASQGIAEQLLTATDNASVFVEIPLTAGKHEINTGTPWPAKIVVQKGTVLKVDLQTEKDPSSGEQIIKYGSMTVNKPLEFTNPSSIFNIDIAGVPDWVMTAAADIELKGVYINDGEISLDGKLDLWGPFFDKQLKDVVKSQDLPTLNSLNEMLKGRFTLPGASTGNSTFYLDQQVGDLPGSTLLDNILKLAGGQQGTYGIELNGNYHQIEGLMGTSIAADMSETSDQVSVDGKLGVHFDGSDASISFAGNANLDTALADAHVDFNNGVFDIEGKDTPEVSVLIDDAEIDIHNANVVYNHGGQSYGASVNGEKTDAELLLDDIGINYQDGKAVVENGTLQVTNPLNVSANVGLDHTDGDMMALIANGKASVTAKDGSAVIKDNQVTGNLDFSASIDATTTVHYDTGEVVTAEIDNLSINDGQVRINNNQLDNVNGTVNSDNINIISTETPPIPIGFKTADEIDWSGRINSALSSAEYTVGNFIVNWNGEQGRNGIQISHAGDPDQVIWETIGGENFLSVANREGTVEDSRGSFAVNEYFNSVCTQQTVDSIETIGDRIVIKGSLSNVEDPSLVSKYEMQFYQTDQGLLDFNVTVDSLDDNPDQFDMVQLRLPSAADEKIYGFGQQFTYLDANGREISILSQEGGVGRGAEGITQLVDLVSPGSAGDENTTYASIPHFISSAGRSLFLKNSERSVFDMSAANTMEIRVASNQLSGAIVQGSTPLEMIENYTQYSGRMNPLPSWLNNGAVVGMQGGTEDVMEVYQALKEKGAPISAFWLQDWVGKRNTIAGSQLWWNWELDKNMYPNWDEMVETLKNDGIRVMGYINPFLVDVADREGVYRNLYQEGVENGYLINNKDGQPYMVGNTDFSAGMIDLTNPEARQWMKEVIKEQMLGSGLNGWMADFGEALPFDAVLFSGESAESYHNKYPQEWAKLNREAIQEAGLEGEVAFFSRSAYTQSPGISTLFWEGDQMTSWDAHDGLKSAITGMISGGFSGFSLNHSDAGGYTSLSVEGIGIDRSKELLSRWMEMSAFTTLLRTHEGNQPELNAQIYSDEEMLDSFVRSAKIFEALAPYRSELMEEASEKGYPVVRHPWLHFSDDANVHDLQDQFMLGSEFMVAPVVEEGARSRAVYLPAGQWVNTWTGEVVGDSMKGGWINVDAPLGEPPVFYIKGSTAGQEFRETLIAQGLI